MKTLDTYWAACDRQYYSAQLATTADQLIEALNAEFPPSSGDAFYAGSGGNDQLLDALSENRNWCIVWMVADYHFAARDAHGDYITYTEGDVSKSKDKPIPPPFR